VIGSTVNLEHLQATTGGGEQVVARGHGDQVKAGIPAETGVAKLAYLLPTDPPAQATTPPGSQVDGGARRRYRHRSHPMGMFWHRQPLFDNLAALPYWPP
jgi:hypothetical protein